MPVGPLRPHSSGRCPGHHSWASLGCAVRAHLVQVDDQRSHRPGYAAPVEENSDVQ